MIIKIKTTKGLIALTGPEIIKHLKPEGWKIGLRRGKRIKRAEEMRKRNEKERGKEELRHMKEMGFNRRIEE